MLGNMKSCRTDHWLLTSTNDSHNVSPLTFTNVIRNNPHNLSPTLPACLIENLSWSAVYELSNLDGWQTGNKTTFPRPIISLYHLFSSRKCCLIEPKIADISRVEISNVPMTHNIPCICQYNGYLDFYFI